jgi:hypothetical protein
MTPVVGRCTKALQALLCAGIPPVIQPVEFQGILENTHLRTGLLIPGVIGYAHYTRRDNSGQQAQNDHHHHQLN